jgi:hypothetical protein
MFYGYIDIMTKTNRDGEVLCFTMHYDSSDARGTS